MPLIDQCLGIALTHMSTTTVGSGSVVPGICSKPDQIRQFLPFDRTNAFISLMNLRKSSPNFSRSSPWSARHPVFVGADVKIGGVKQRDHFLQQRFHQYRRPGVADVETGCVELGVASSGQ